MVKLPGKSLTPERVQAIERQVRELSATTSGRVRTAQTTATTARTKADAAQGTADTASSAATQAQTTAASAGDAAASASAAAAAADATAAAAATAAGLAASDAATASALATAATNAADAAAALAQAANDVSTALGGRVDGLSTSVDTAITAAGGAASAASAAKTAADQASSDAADANSLASSAKTAADTANSAALAASGLAASKGETIFQKTAPTGARANPANLWVDITPDANGNPKNTPNRYNPDTAKWEPITDQKAVDAAAAAAAANSLAASAQSAASAADTKAQGAQSAANGAQTTANNAGQAAAAAQTTADTAKANAATAQTSADAAKLAAATAAAKAVAVAAGVLDNGSAEFDFDSWDSSAKGTIVVQSATVRSGTKAWSATTSGELRQGMIPVKPGDTWRMRWWVRATGTGSPNGGLRLQRSDQTASDKGWYDAGSSSAVVASAFTMQEVSYTVPATGVTHLRARVAFSNPAGITVYFDDIELVNITDAKVAADAAATAQSAAGSAQSTADTAKTNAATAQSTADQAKTAAAAAQSTADTAKADAATAKSAADSANSQALAAAGIANGKGKVIVQVSAPTGANAAAENLWIDISTGSDGKPKNTPNRWNPSTLKWEVITDAATTAAAAAAATAQQAAAAAANAASAAQATADGKPLILFSSTAGPSGTAPTGSIWFLWDTSKNVAGQWLQSGTLAAPVWTPQQIRSDVIANLDVAKLTAGSAAIADVVAQKIAAATGNFQTANVSNLFVTSGATMSQAVIDFLFANVVQAKKITAGMIDATTFNGVTFTGALFKSAASGQRIEMLQTRLDIYNSSDALSGRIFGGLNNGIVTGASLVLQAINGSKSGQFLVAAPLDVSCSVSPAPYVLPGFTYSGTTLKGTISAVAEGLVVKGPLLADEIWYAGDNRRALGPANQSTPNGNRVVLAATVDRLSYAYANAATGVRTEVPVMTGDPYGDTANVYLAATDFRSAAGVSHGLGDTGWINVTPANGWANQPGTRLRYRARHGVFYLQGYLNSANTTATTFATIPSNYTPSQDIRVPATNGTGSAGTWMDFPVGANGTLGANTARNPNFAVSWPLDQ